MKPPGTTERTIVALISKAVVVSLIAAAVGGMLYALSQLIWK